MAERKQNLYRWERFSKPRVYSRSQKVTTNDDIQDWIKKVEDASNHAAAVAFDVPYSGGRGAARRKVEDVRLHDAAYSEAQELLQQWVEEKINLDEEDEDYESGTRRKSRGDIKREWDDLLADNDPDYDDDLESLTSPKSASAKSKAFYSKILDDENDSALEEILSSMMAKDVVGERVVKDLGLDDDYKKQSDPTTKMKVRHLQVKENRERREAEKRRKLQEAQAQKEARLQAKRMIQKEEAEKESRRKKEEAEINKEMARIRKEMADERKKAEEEKQKERFERELKDQEAEVELQRQKLVEDEAREQIKQEDLERQRKITQLIERAEAKNTRTRLTLLHKYFSGWYRVVAERRVEMGKARAMADWKLLLHTWKRWRTFHRQQRGEEDAQRHLREVREEQRNKLKATQHYRVTILRRCFAAWLLYLGLERRLRDVNTEQKVTQNKMAAFLQAAASGALWQPDNNNMRKSTSMENVSSAPQDSARQKVEDMFSQPARPRRGSLSARTSSTTTERSARGQGEGHSKPKQAWQITRKHLKLTKEEMANLTQSPDQGQGEGSTGGQETGRSEGSRSDKTNKKQPWEKKYVVNTTEHRTAAQAKILEQQQKQIKEQQRLITELTYLQKQQMLQTQLTQQQMLRQQATGAPPGVDLPKLEAHIQELQKQLLTEGGVAGGEGGVAGGEGGVVQTGDTEGVGEVTSRTDSTLMSPPGSDAPCEMLTTKNVNKKNSRDGQTGAQSTARSQATSSGATTNRTTNSKHANFLKAMEDRASERSRIKAEREEKKRKADQERLARLAAEAEEEKKREEEEKRRKVEEHREKKRLEKAREVEREQEAARFRHQQEIAESHHLRSLVKYRGWRPWRRLVEIMRNRMVVAETHHKQELLRKVLVQWQSVVREDVDLKNGLADEMIKYILIRRCFRNWRRVGECVAIQEKKAGRFFTSRLLSRTFTAWRDHTEEEKIASWQKERKAKEHNLMRLKKRGLLAFRKYPKTRRELEEKELRRAEMRRKVAGMLPDYEARSKPVRASTSGDFNDFFS